MSSPYSYSIFICVAVKVLACDGVCLFSVFSFAGRSEWYRIAYIEIIRLSILSRHTGFNRWPDFGNKSNVSRTRVPGMSHPAPERAQSPNIPNRFLTNAQYHSHFVEERKQES